MFPDRLTLFSHPAILIMLAVMTAMFIALILRLILTLRRAKHDI